MIGIGAIGLAATILCDTMGLNVTAITDQDAQIDRISKLGSALSVKRKDCLSDLAKPAEDAGIDLVILTTNHWKDYFCVKVDWLHSWLSGDKASTPWHELFYRKRLTKQQDQV